MSNLRTLQTLVTEIESELDRVTDPVELMPLVDAVRADLAVVLTGALRRSANRAYEQGRMDDLAAATWRSRRYLVRMVEHSTRSAGQHDRLLDVISRNHLDLDDLARLRGRG